MPSSWLRWSALLGWSLLIFALVPFANDLWAGINTRLDAEALRRLVVALVAVAVVAAAAWVVRVARAEWRRLVWIAGLGTLAAVWMARLPIGAEPIHLVEYAVLAVLAFRALNGPLGRAGASPLVPRGDRGGIKGPLRDRSVYLAAAAVTALVGTVDEIVQWLTPGRFWDLGDVGLNAAIGGMVQLLIWQGLRPATAAARPGPRSLRVAVRLLALEVVVLGLSLANTPARIEWYAARVPGLGYLGRERSTRMVEYGHRYLDPAIGTFRSRLAPDELERADREGAAAAAEVLARFAGRAGYHELLRRHSPARDPLLYEVGAHLFYRGLFRRRAEGAARQGADVEEQVVVATAAFRENLLLERYFPHTLARSGLALRPAVREAMAALHDPAAAFDSEVSNGLLTAFSEPQARWSLLLFLTALVAVDRWLTGRIRAPRSRGE